MSARTKVLNIVSEIGNLASNYPYRLVRIGSSDDIKHRIVVATKFAFPNETRVRGIQ
ncbi:MAG: hypothetical protein WAL37_05500 [Xanthobacteraceae bacterium]